MGEAMAVVLAAFPFKTSSGFSVWTNEPYNDPTFFLSPLLLILSTQSHPTIS